MKNGTKYPIPRRLPVGFRRSIGGVGMEVDPAKADGLRLALAIADTGKLSVRSISAIAAAHGVTDAKGKPLAPATMWRILKNPLYAKYLKRA